MFEFNDFAITNVGDVADMLHMIYDLQDKELRDEFKLAYARWIEESGNFTPEEAMTMAMQNIGFLNRYRNEYRGDSRVRNAFWEATHPVFN